MKSKEIAIIIFQLKGKINGYYHGFASHLKFKGTPRFPFVVIKSIKLSILQTQNCLHDCWSLVLPCQTLALTFPFHRLPQKKRKTKRNVK